MDAITMDLRAGLAFCTRLPVMVPRDGHLARAVWTFPIVGVLVGMVGAVVYWIANGLDLPHLVAAALAVAAIAVVTGCLHEDGLADTADGFGAGGTKERILVIMRDSRIGTYGVVALILSFLLRIAAVASLGSSGLVAAALIGAHAGARAGLPLFMRAVRTARHDGLSARAGTPDPGAVTAAALLGMLTLMLCLGVGGGLLAALLVVGGLLVIGRLASKKIGGQTGDVLGAVEQTCEILILLVAASLL